MIIIMGKLSVALKNDRILSRLSHFAPSAWLKLKRASRLFMWRLDDTKLQQMQQALIDELQLVFVDDVHEVCEHGDAECLWLLLSQGVSVKLRDPEGATLLQKATHTNQLPILQLLLERGASVNAKGAYGYTPLHEVCYLGHAESCAFLLDRKANCDALSKNGSTPLMVAARGGHANVVATMLRHGADSEDGGDKPWTPLYVAIGEGHLDVCQVLLSYGASAEGGEEYLGQLEQQRDELIKMGDPEEIAAAQRRAAAQVEIYKMLQIYGNAAQAAAMMSTGDAEHDVALMKQQQIVSSLQYAQQPQVAMVH